MRSNIETDGYLPPSMRTSDKHESIPRFPLRMLKKGSIGWCALWPAAEPSQKRRENRCIIGRGSWSMYRRIIPYYFTSQLDKRKIVAKSQRHRINTSVQLACSPRPCLCLVAPVMVSAPHLGLASTPSQYPPPAEEKRPR